MAPPLEKHLEELCRAVASFLEEDGSSEPPEETKRPQPEPDATQTSPAPSGARSLTKVTLSETQQHALARWIRPGAHFEEALTITGRMIMAPMRSSVVSVPNVGTVLGVLGMLLIALYSFAILPLVFVWLYVQALLHKEELAQGTAQRVTGTFVLSVYRGKDSGIRGARLTLPQGTLHLSGQQATQLGQVVDLDAAGQVSFAGTVVLVNVLGPNHLIAAYDRSDHLLCGDA